MGHALTVLTTHSIVAFVNSTAFTVSSLRQIEKMLTAAHITYTHVGINMAKQIGEGEPHWFEERVERDSKVRQDLTGEPIEDADENLFTDGCCFRRPSEGLTSRWEHRSRHGQNYKIF